VLIRPRPRADQQHDGLRAVDLAEFGLRVRTVEDGVERGAVLLGDALPQCADLGTVAGVAVPGMRCISGPIASQ